jgi:hypothetical protein
MPDDPQVAVAIRAAEETPALGYKLSRDGRQLIVSRTERRRTAYHEAGHAVVHALLAQRFAYVTIEPIPIHPETLEQIAYDGVGPVRFLMGRVCREGHFPEGEPPPEWVGREIITQLAGGIAERIYRRDGEASGELQDHLSVWALCSALLQRAAAQNGTDPQPPDEQAQAQLFDEFYQRAETLVRRHWTAIDAVAQRLIRDRTLKEHEVLRIQKHENFMDALIDVISVDQDLELLFHKAAAALGHGAETCPSETQDDHAAVRVVRQPPPKEIGDFMDALRRAAETPDGH